MIANIFKIERLNTHNGPGFRTVLYFKGCPLHCTWCHNPEGISKKKQVWVNHTKCISCGICVNTCSDDAVQLKQSKIIINQNKCTGCLRCSSACPTGAMEKIGVDYTIDELMINILQDKYLFEASGGGITVTGGEPGLHANFVSELFKRCKEQGIHTAFDTSGSIPVQSLTELIEYTDHIYLDLKIFNNEKSIKYTGLKSSQFIETLNWLKLQQINPSLTCLIRTPLIPGLTDHDENLEAFAKILSSQFPGISWELCMFNSFCEDKYNRLNLTWTLTGLKQKPADYQRLVDFCKNHPQLSIQLSGLSEDFKKPNQLLSQ